MLEEEYLRLAKEYLITAVRQHRHNYGSEELIAAYDYEETQILVAHLIKNYTKINGEMAERPKALPC